MSLERKDLRLKLDADIHAGLDMLAEMDGMLLSDLGEKIIVEWVRRRIHEATVVAERAARLGISGSRRESSGTSGSGRE